MIDPRVVGSTALSATLDPEDMREVIRAYQHTVAGEIERFEGHVAKFMGDGVLAYFGWPRAYEDAADRALRAGLAITGAIRNLRNPAGEALSARVGIATGLVVVGDLVREGASQEQAVVGERPNLAARLQVLAGPGGVVTVFLASDATSYVTGAVLFADGERTAIDGKFTPPRDVSPRASAAAVGGAFTTRP